MKIAGEACSSIGLRRRLNRLFTGEPPRTVMVPLDALLIDNSLPNPRRTVLSILEGGPDAILGYPGLFRGFADQLQGIAGVLNLTASTIRSEPNRKRLVGKVNSALKLGLEAVAVHVNVGSQFEAEMLRALGRVCATADAFGVPVVAIMYARGETREETAQEQTESIAHAVRVGVELGANVIKTHFTGSEESFRSVVDVAAPIPVIVAGGADDSPARTLRVATESIRAGAAGVCFGRRVFQHKDPARMVRALRAIVHDQYDASQVADWLASGEAESLSKWK